MRQVPRITINPDHPWAKEAKIDAEQAATAAAERARKEVLERAAQRAAADKVYLDSIRHYDKLKFKNEELIEHIRHSSVRHGELLTQASEEWKRGDHYRKELQAKCSHDLVLEHRTSYTDEYEQWHDGHYERKCVECLLEEESSYRVDECNYSYGRKKYAKLEKSQVVLLRKTIDGKEFELEFDDLKW